MPIVDWNHIRALFPVCERWAYFNNAYVAPTATPAAEVMRDCIEQTSLHGETCLDQWFAPIDRCRQLAAGMINANW